MAALSDPLTLPCGLVLPNRIMKAALSEGMANKRHAPDERLERLYSTWSKGGYGLIITGNVMVDGTQLGEPGNVVIEDERNLDALSRWAKATKDGGVPIWAQLNHPGRQSNPLELGATRWPPVRCRWPCPARLRRVPSRRPRSRTSSSGSPPPPRSVRRRASTASRSMARTATWSPSSSRRCRISARTSGAATRRGGCAFCSKWCAASARGCHPVSRSGLKLNSADFQRGGFTEDESRGVLAALAGEGLDLIEVSGGSYEQPAMMGAAADSTRRPRGLLPGIRAHGAQHRRRRSAGGHRRIPVAIGHASRGRQRRM